MSKNGFVAIAIAGLFAAGTLVPQPARAIDALNYRSSTGERMDGGPESSARPGEAYYHKAVSAYDKGKYKFAADMYRVSASWAFKPSHCNLGVMYFRGDGVDVDRPLGAAWLALAAERGDEDYVQARDAAVGDMSDEEIAQANHHRTHALRRCIGDEARENRWIQARNSATGSHLGMPGARVLVSSRSDATGAPPANIGNKSRSSGRLSYEVVGADSVDGSYRQLRESDNPYDAAFVRAPKAVATVLPLIPYHGEAAAEGGGATPEGTDNGPQRRFF